MVSSSRSRLHLSAPKAAADLRSCPGCSGLIEAGMRTCPACKRWLGYGTVALWLSLGSSGALLILFAFFLPWVGITSPAPGHLFSGYELAQTAHHIAVTGGARPTYAASLALYLVPASALAILGLIGLFKPLGLNWPQTGRLLVALATVPLQISLLAAFFALVHLTDSQTAASPQLGLAGALLGSAIVVVSGAALVGPTRLRRTHER